MKRMSGLDASFLYVETPSVHMHTLKVGVLELAPDTREGAFERFCASVSDNLAELPSLRRSVVFVPGGVDHPRWREHRRIDVAWHVFRDVIEAPGGDAEMDAAIAAIASTPLPRDRPLWQVWWLEGRADGAVVFVAKLHHALADGTAAAGLLAHIMGARSQQAAGASAPSKPPPSRLRLLREAARERRRALDEVGPLLQRTTRRALSALSDCAAKGDAVPGTMATSRTPLSCSLTPQRAFATERVDMQQLQRVRKALGVSVNDVVLFMVDRALRAWLREQGIATVHPLVASVPMSSEGPSQALRKEGNRVANMLTTLCSDVVDPVEQLHAIRRNAQAAQRFQRTLGMDTMERWMQLLPPVLLKAVQRLYARTGLVDRRPPFANVIVSNVRGPAQRLSSGPAQLRSLYSSGPVVQGIALNVTAWSYCDELTFSILADARAMPEPHLFAHHLPAALQLLATRIPEMEDVQRPDRQACA